MCILLYFYSCKSVGVIKAKLGQAAVSVKPYSVMVKLHGCVPAGLAPGSPPWWAVRGRGQWTEIQLLAGEFVLLFSLLFCATDFLLGLNCNMKYYLLEYNHFLIHQVSENRPLFISNS